MTPAFAARLKPLLPLWGFIAAYEACLLLYLALLALVPFSPQWKALPAWRGLALSLLIQLAVYFVVTAGVWLTYGALRLRLGIGGLLDPQPLRTGQIPREIRRGLLSCAVYALYTFACLRLSAGIWPASWMLGVLQAAAFLAFYDLSFYLSHRLLHTHPFGAFHGVHHGSVRVTPWSVHSLHPLEAAINQLPFLLFMLVWPTGFGMVVLFQILLMFMTASGHSNYDPFANAPGIDRAKSFWRFHQRHHQFGRGNFGFMGLHWDWLFGTMQPVRGSR